MGVIATKDIRHIALFFVDASPYAHEIYKHLEFVDTDEKQCINGLIFYPMKAVLK